MYNVGMMNNFVDIIFDPTSKQFTCEFTNKQDASEKTCSITLYRTEDCEQRQTLMLTAQVVSTDSQLTLVPNDLESDTTIYCYVASASNDTFNVNVTGTIGQSKCISMCIYTHLCQNCMHLCCRRKSTNN